MHFYIKLTLALASVATASCQTTGLPGINASQNSVTNCLTYQRCQVTGKLAINGSGQYADYTLTTPENRCFPLLLSNQQRLQAGQYKERTVKISGLLLLRQTEGPPETLSVGYFDRTLPSYGSCKGEVGVLYVQNIR